MTTGRLVRAYFMEAWYESIRMLRAPGFSIPFLLLPALIYLLFGVLIFGEALGKAPKEALGVFLGLTVFGMMGPGIFGFGVNIALERDQGLLRLKRAMPVPTGSYLLAKMAMAMLFNAIIMVTMLAAAVWVAHLHLSLPQSLSLGAINVVGALPFCAMGLLCGVLVSGSAAPGVVNLVYLPMMWLSGLFIALPPAMQALAPVWPPYHLLQLSYWAIGSRGAGSPILHAAVLAGVTGLFCLLATRRLARVG